MATPTQTEIDRLWSLYRKGVTEVEYDGERVKYRSRNEMKAIILEMERELNGSTTGGQNSRRSYPTYTKGV